MAQLNKLANSIYARIKRLGFDNAGVAAIEFALVLPILVFLYFGSMEVSQAVEVNKKLERAATMVADLVTQRQGNISAADLKGIMDISATALGPYRRTSPTIKVTAIQVSDSSTPVAKEIWWRRIRPLLPADGGLPPSQIANPALPTDINVRKSFWIRVEAAIEYRPVLTYTQAGAGNLGTGGLFGIRMTKTEYLSSRSDAVITCNDCAS